MSSEKGRTFLHLQWKDRLRIEKMLKEKKSKAEIAQFAVDYAERDIDVLRFDSKDELDRYMDTFISIQYCVYGADYIR